LEQWYGSYGEAREEEVLPELPVQYADYAIWRRHWLEGEELERGLEYWKQQLAGIPERLELPADRSRGARRSAAAGRYQAQLSEAATRGLKRISQEHGATLYMTLLAAYGVLLSRYSGQEDVVVGSPVANRQECGVEGLIGFFVNTLAMRMRVRAGMSFAELLGQVKQTALEAYQHQDVPFERLVEELSPQRSLHATPLVQVTFAMQNAPWQPQQLRGLEVEVIERDQHRVRFDLELQAFETNSQLRLVWTYNRDLFDAWRIEQMAKHYVLMLEAIEESAD